MNKTIIGQTECPWCNSRHLIYAEDLIEKSGHEAPKPLDMDYTCVSCKKEFTFVRDLKIKVSKIEYEKCPSCNENVQKRKLIWKTMDERELKCCYSCFIDSML